MKRLSLGAALLLACWGASAHAASGELRIAADMNNAPFSSIQSGKFVGFDIEMGNEIARRLNMKPVWSNVKFEDLLLNISRKKYDIAISSQAIKEERKKSVDFSNPYYCDATILLGKGKPPMLKDIGKGNVGVIKGTIYADYALKNYPHQLIRFNNDKEMLSSLLFGKLDYVIQSRFGGLLMESANKNLKIGEQIQSQEVGMSVAKGNTALLKKVNAALNDMLADGTYAKLSQKYFKGDIRCK